MFVTSLKVSEVRDTARCNLNLCTAVVTLMCSVCFYRLYTGVSQVINNLPVAISTKKGLRSFCV